MEISERERCKGWGEEALGLTALYTILKQEMARKDLPAFISDSKVKLGITLHPRKLSAHGNTPSCRDVVVEREKKN